MQYSFLECIKYILSSYSTHRTYSPASNTRVRRLYYKYTAAIFQQFYKKPFNIEVETWFSNYETYIITLIKTLLQENKSNMLAYMLASLVLKDKI